MALVYLHLYLPFMSAVTHIVDVSDEPSVLDQSVYASLVAASDEVAVEALLSGDSDRLLNGHCGSCCASTWPTSSQHRSVAHAADADGRRKVVPPPHRRAPAGAARRGEAGQATGHAAHSERGEKGHAAGRPGADARSRAHVRQPASGARARADAAAPPSRGARARADGRSRHVAARPDSLRRADRAAARRDRPLCRRAGARACEAGGRPQRPVSHAGPGALAAREAHLRESGGAAAQAGGRDHAARGSACRSRQRARGTVVCRSARPAPRLQDRR
eukprot:scaffold26377_cov45-Phaeocystis_antarctica.AAC.4